MKTGVIILSVFAATWAIAGLVSVDAAPWLWALPIAISVMLAIWGWRLALPAEDAAAGKRIGRLVGLWSAIEGVAIFLAANVLISLGQPTMVGPAICGIVGLHFIPLARGMPLPIYYVTATAMILAAIIAIVLPASWRLPAVGLAGSVALWLTCFTIIRNARTAVR